MHHHVTLTGHLYGARGLYANREALAALPAELAQAVRDCARQAIEHQRRAAAEYESELRRRLERAGVAFVDLTPEEHAAFTDATGRVIERARAAQPEDTPWPT